MGDMWTGENVRRRGVEPEDWEGFHGFNTGIEITRDHRRRGYAAEATGHVLNYMFAEQRYNKREVEVYAFNDASLALYRNLGFV